MSKVIINAGSLPHIPWEDRPKSSNPEKEIMWRYSKNPIIPRDLTLHSNSIFNSAVVPFKDGFAGVFRCDDVCRRMNIHAGKSKDGLKWDICDEPIKFIKTSPDLPDSEYKYDPRVVFIEDRWYIIWCNGYHGPCLGLGYTFDFEKFYLMENPTTVYNRNGVLFPRKIGGNYALLSRPSDSGHTPFGDIFYSESPDLTFWGKHRHVMSPLNYNSAWQSTKIGAGPAPIETSEGWLLFYHGVLTSCNGFVYSFGAALLDIEKPWNVIARGQPYVINPREPYELTGDVPNVTFPCAALVDGDTGRLVIYYGCADTVTGIVFGKIDEIVDWIKKNGVDNPV
ncbi:MAG: glycoside hydrolase family 130 protein [Spirochaetaceae bacterium]|jgi:beta-1,4-mannooligosaccharide/beta-1,4-mannosyl-N-acetylglucosamine phosphorylase|nr:glycoside hydrolase family 130 protein [Spirochaetaceae bacterium]